MKLICWVNAPVTPPTCFNMQTLVIYVYLCLRLLCLLKISLYKKLTKLIIYDYLKSTAFICRFVELIKQKLNIFVYGNTGIHLETSCAREIFSFIRKS